MKLHPEYIATMERLGFPCSPAIQFHERIVDHFAKYLHDHKPNGEDLAYVKWQEKFSRRAMNLISKEMQEEIYTDIKRRCGIK